MGGGHPFTQKMEKVLQESTTKIKGIIEKQNKRLTSKYAAPTSDKKPASNSTTARGA